MPARPLSGCEVQVLSFCGIAGFTVQGLRLRVQGLGCRVQGVGLMTSFRLAGCVVALKL